MRGGKAHEKKFLGTAPATNYARRRKFFRARVGWAEPTGSRGCAPDGVPTIRISIKKRMVGTARRAPLPTLRIPSLVAERRQSDASGVDAAIGRANLAGYVAKCDSTDVKYA